MDRGSGVDFYPGGEDFYPNQLKALSPRGLLVDSGQVAAFQHVVGAGFFSNAIEDAMRLRVVRRRIRLIASQAKRLSQEVVALGERCLQPQLVAIAQAAFQFLPGAGIVLVGNERSGYVDGTLDRKVFQT